VEKKDTTQLDMNKVMKKHFERRNISSEEAIKVTEHMEVLLKPKIELPYDPAIHLLGTYIKESKSAYNGGDTCTPMFIAALCTIDKLWNQPMCLFE
jgi:hypothetical protein